VEALTSEKHFDRTKRPEGCGARKQQGHIKGGRMLINFRGKKTWMRGAILREKKTKKKGVK